MILIEHPEAFLLIPVWLGAAWMFPSARLFMPLRVLAGLLLMLAWLNPQLNRQGKGMDLWVMVDRSLSASDWIEPRLPEMQTLLEQSRGRHDRLMLIDFAEDVIERDPLQSAILSGRRDSTRIDSALHFTLSRLNPRRISRLLMITDGYSTEPFEDAAARLIGQGIPMDVRFMLPTDDTDFQVESISAPVHVRPGEPFIIDARISGTDDVEVPCILLRDGVPSGRATARLQNGRGQVRWTDSIAGSVAVEYAVQIEPAQDTWAGNNRQKVWVEARGGQRVLLVTSYRDDPLAEALKLQGLSVDVVTDASSLQPGHLAGASAVILNNVPAYIIPNEVMEAFPFYVRETGGGLIMIGGKTSFASGGYFESPVDELLPVSMELKQEHRRLAVAMAIVMDRSGSMMAGVSGGGGKTKMDLANEGAARAIELLGATDAVTVFAVDSEAHRVIPLTTLGENRAEILSLVRKIQSAGGGIFVYNGLRAGWDELKKAPQGQRHIILFSDAADSEQPQGYEVLVDEMISSGSASLSVIALGTEQDSDADLLKAIAARGNGRIFFNADANTLPQLFAQETVALSRSAFLTDPTSLQAQPGWLEMASDMLAWPAQVEGYNLSYLRPEAAASLLSGDEYEAPLLAQWVRGMGKVGAVTFPLAGEYSQSVRSWSAYGDFIRTLTRWCMREDVPPGLVLRTVRVGETLKLELHYDEAWIDAWAETPPQLITSTSGSDGTTRQRWRRIRPGIFEAEVVISGSQILNGAIQAGRHVIPFGPIAGTIGAEWQFNPAMPKTLQQVAQASGGQIRVDLADIWKSSGRRDVRGIREILLVLTLSVFLIEALWSRLGWNIPVLGKYQKRTSVAAPSIAAPKETEKGLDTMTLPVEEPTPSSRKSLFEKARHRGKL